MQKIAAAFVKAKMMFRPAIKEKSNPAFKGTKYADLSSCIEAVDDAFLANGIVMYQECQPDDTGVTVETVLLHESGESIRSGKLHVPASKQDPQGYGSALTYARRYSLMAACGIAPEDDDGNSASSKQHTPAAMPESVIVDYKQAMFDAKDVEALRAEFAKAWAAANAIGDTAARAVLKEYYDMRKEDLQVAA